MSGPSPVKSILASRSSLRRFAVLSILAALATMGLKGAAYMMTGSVGLLSDALESLVNLAGAMMAFGMLTVAARPEDDEHPHGHGKAEYFSSGVEGTLILLAAISIGWAAIMRLLHPRPLEQVTVGLVVAVAASLVNLGVALVLMRTGKREQSITLEANAHHLLTDVWTSVGVVVGVAATAMTGWQPLDSIVALLVALNIVWTGTSIVRDSVHGLMDRAVAPAEQEALLSVLDRYRPEGADFHALRTRQAGSRRFVSVHVLVPGNWSVRDGHRLLERIESDIRKTIPNVSVLTHLESIEDPASWADVGLDRPAGS